MTARILVAIGAAVLAGLLALPGPVWPLLPAQSLDVEVAAMNAVYGRLAAIEGGGGSQVANDRGDSALQALAGMDFDAEELSVLRYRMRNFSSALELVFLWRLADDPEMLHSATIPKPRGGDQTFALDQLPNWQGRVVEIGFGQIPTAMQTPPGTPFPPFSIESIRLESMSLSNALRAQVDSMSALRPWAQRSINSLGRELSEAPRRSTLVPIVVALATFILLSVILLRRRALLPVLAAVAVVWLLVDWSWQRQLLAQNRLTERTVSTTPFADVDLAGVADRFRAWYRQRSEAPKVLVAAPSAYTTYRMIWHLLPMDAATWNVALGRVDQLVPGTLILVPADLVDRVVAGTPSDSTLTPQRSRRVHVLDEWQVIEVVGGGVTP